MIAEPLTDLLGDINAPNESIEGAQSFLTEISGFASNAVSFGISRLQDTANLFLTIILVPIFLFFWLWDTDTLSSGFSKLVPKKRKFLVRVWNETNTNFQNYFKAKFIEVFVVAVTGSLNVLGSRVKQSSSIRSVFWTQPTYTFFWSCVYDISSTYS